MSRSGNHHGNSSIHFIVPCPTCGMDSTSQSYSKEEMESEIAQGVLTHFCGRCMRSWPAEKETAERIAQKFLV